MDLSRAGLGHILIIGTSCVAVSCGPALARCQPLWADIGPALRMPGAAAQDLPSLAKCLVILVEVCLLFQYTDKTTAVLFLCGRHEYSGLNPRVKPGFMHALGNPSLYITLSEGANRRAANRVSWIPRSGWIPGARCLDFSVAPVLVVWTPYPPPPLSPPCLLVGCFVHTP